MKKGDRLFLKGILAMPRIKMDKLKIKDNVSNFLSQDEVVLIVDTSVISPLKQINCSDILNFTFSNIEIPQGVNTELKEANTSFGTGSIHPTNISLAELPLGIHDVYDDGSLYVAKGEEAIQQFSSKSYENNNIDSSGSRYSGACCANNEHKPNLSNQPLLIQDNTTQYKFERVKGIGDWGVVQSVIYNATQNRIPIILTTDKSLRNGFRKNQFLVLGIEGWLEIAIHKGIIGLKKAIDIHKKILKLDTWRLHNTKNFDFERFHKNEAFDKTWWRLHQLINKRYGSKL